MFRLAAGVAAALGAALVASPSAVDAEIARSSGLANKKDRSTSAYSTEESAPLPLLGTLVQTHTDERVPLDDLTPSADRFARLLADRVTGEKRELDPKLLELLRSIARHHPRARFELVSGYRSPKLNEMMRKKGHHVASHSQHSLGHAIDFRVVVEDDAADVTAGSSPSRGILPESRGMDPRVLEKEIRELGWQGGVGVYTLKTDWFVHADVSKLRRWDG